MNFVKDYMNIKNKYLSKYACKDEEATYFFPLETDFRGTFYHDIDKIIYSLAFVRYMDKTQVFSYQKHGHITKRMLHIQLVSKIARTISRALGLNEDLTEAIALGHDLGHVPFGHIGERILNEISLKNNLGYFNHNVHSVRILMNIENYGRGLNVSKEVLDGILCHNGEFAKELLVPIKKTKEEFLKEYNNTYIDKSCMDNYVASSLEGCVVRISDMIAYLGRDIEDALRLNIIEEKDIPNDIKENLGTNNSEIIKTIIYDLINNSIDKPYIKLSGNIHKSIVSLKKFNYQFIYNKANTPEMIDNYKLMLEKVYDKFLSDLKNENKESIIYTSYLRNMDSSYKNNNSKERIALDYVAGMTDSFLQSQYDSLCYRLQK